MELEARSVFFCNIFELFLNVGKNCKLWIVFFEWNSKLDLYFFMWLPNGLKQCKYDF